MIKLVIIAQLYNLSGIWNSFRNHLGYLHIVCITVLSVWLSLRLLLILLLAHASLKLDLSAVRVLIVKSTIASMLIFASVSLTMLALLCLAIVYQNSSMLCLSIVNVYVHALHDMETRSAHRRGDNPHDDV